MADIQAFSTSQSYEEIQRSKKGRQELMKFPCLSGKRAKLPVWVIMADREQRKPRRTHTTTLFKMDTPFSPSLLALQ